MRRSSGFLRKFGCEDVGFMDNFDGGAVLLAFSLQLRASAKGWAQMFLKQNPWDDRHRRTSRHDYEQAALRQGQIAINSILRDWIKGLMTAVECGILSFEAVFKPFMLGSDGRPMLERAVELLPKPEDKVVALPGR